MFKKISLSKSFYVFSSIICFLLLIILSGILISIAIEEKKNIRTNLVTEAHIVSKVIREYTSETTNLAEFIARKIEQDPTNLDFINFLFKRKFALDISLSEEDMIYWPTFEWADKNSRIIVSSLLGILKDSKKEHLIPSKYANNYDVWEPIYGYEVTDNKISLNIILSDDNENHLGTLISYIDLKRMVQRIRSSLRFDDISFVILNDKNEIIISSAGEVADRDFFRFLIGNINFNTSPYGELEEDIKHDDKIYVAYSKVPKTPFKIIMGKNKGELYYSYYNIILYGVIFIIAVLFILVVSLYFMYLLTIRPVKIITQAGKEIIRTGDFTVLPPHKSSKEIFRLCKVMINFKKCKNRLESSYRDLSNSSKDLTVLNDNLKHDIRSYELSDQNIISFKERLNLKKSRCISNSIHGMAMLKEIILKNNTSYGEILDFINVVENNLRQSNECILPPLEIESFSILDTIEECREILSRQIAQSGAVLEIIEPKESYCIQADRLCLQQIIIALITLSIVFVNEGNKIEITIEKEGGDIVISISDDGLIDVESRDVFIKNIKQNAVLFDCKYDLEKLKEQASTNGANIEFIDTECGVQYKLSFQPIKKTKIHEEKDNNILLFKNPNEYK
ncbi:MAG: hypothetical protein O2970_11760 [Proteobacteria bacterium]|nr:hypothetical protein [Pseudomonadota bacterium]